MKIANQCCVLSLSSARAHTHTHAHTIKKRHTIEGPEKRNSATVTEPFSFAKRALIFTNDIPKWDGSELYKHRKEKKQLCTRASAESWSNHLYIKLHFLQITIRIQK
uniref:Uncharacterized protein n=1 Tax=Anguilla anguilla TaxID=7936 RepID=A0A0E9WF20_ANGAN